VPVHLNQALQKVAESKLLAVEYNNEKILQALENNSKKNRYYLLAGSLIIAISILLSQ
jgi:hypothetical protein